MFGFSNEVIGQVVYGARMGNLAVGGSAASDGGSGSVQPSAAAKARITRFSDTLLELFRTMADLQTAIPLYMLFPTPMFRRFCRAVDTVEEIGSELLADTDAVHAARAQRDPLYRRTDLVAHMRERGLAAARVDSNAVTMFTAGSDSTTHSLMWLIHNLGRFPAVQEHCRAEILQHLPASGEITADAIQACRYMRAVIKESLRLTPTAVGFVRVLDVPVVRLAMSALMFLLHWPNGTAFQGVYLFIF
jgi:cytochrome P450